MGEEVQYGLVDIGHIDRAIAGLRGSYGKKVNARTVRCRHVGGKGQFLLVCTQQIVETWLMEGCHTPRERRDALGIHVDSCDVVPQLRHGRCVDCAEIAAANDRKFHPITLDARPGVAGGPAPRGLSPRSLQQFLLPSRRQAPVGDQARRGLPTAHGFSPEWG